MLLIAVADINSLQSAAGNLVYTRLSTFLRKSDNGIPSEAVSYQRLVI